MKNHLDRLPSIIEAIAAIKETVIANVVLLGQTPAPTFKEERRRDLFLERLADTQVDECTTDGFGNAVAIIRGTNPDAPPIFITAHLDIHHKADADLSFTVAADAIAGPGVADNSLGVGVLASLPELFQHLDLQFESDIVIVGVIQSLGKGNLRGIRHLLKTWATPIRGAICVESVELGRLDYYSAGMIRADVHCEIGSRRRWEPMFRPNAILVLNDVINHILELRLPQRPRSRVVVGEFRGGFKHGLPAFEASMGLEIQSDDDRMVRSIHRDVTDIVDGAAQEYGVRMGLKIVSNVSAANLKYQHPLVRCVGDILSRLGHKPVANHSESELSIFLARGTPAVTIGLTEGDDPTPERAVVKIEPMYKGIAQLVTAIAAIDSGVCDEHPMA